jgi:hypothetical protein
MLPKLPKYKNGIFYTYTGKVRGHAVAQLVEALCYKPEGRGFPDVVTGFFN